MVIAAWARAARLDHLPYQYRRDVVLRRLKSVAVIVSFFFAAAVFIPGNNQETVVLHGTLNIPIEVQGLRRVASLRCSLAIPTLFITKAA